MKVFISGIAGFLGSHLADKMIENGMDVSGCDNLIGGYRENVPAKAEFHEADCCDFDTMLRLVKDADIVYHCAATAYEGLSAFSPHFVTRNIVDASVSLISAAIQNKVKRFIYCSSMARYGTNVCPFTEDMEPRPQDPYGIGKFAGEKILENLCALHGMEYVIAVPHNIIGPSQKYDDPYRNVASIMINMMMQGRQPIIYGDGEQKRCFSFVQDDIWVLNRLAFEPGISGEIFNIGPDEEFVTINQLAGEIAKQLHFQLDPVRLKDRPMEVKLANCSAQKIRKRFGYKTTYTLEKGLAEMIRYIRERGTAPFQYHIPLEIVNDKTPASWKNRMF